MQILIETDGSPYAEAALHLGAYLLRGRLPDRPPTLLAVIKREADRPRADTVLARARDLLGVEHAQTRIRIGHPAQEIIHEAHEGNYDLVIVGDRQENNTINRLLQGSMAARVAEHAPCPVLIAKGRIGPIRRILLCDSGARLPSAGLNTKPSTQSRPGELALSRFTTQMAELLDGEEEVTVLHVMSQISAGPGVRGQQLRADVEELVAEHAPEGALLEKDVQMLEKPGIHPHAKVRHGLVLDEILEEARSADYDLVIIGAHPGEGWQHILLDDLARKIIVHLDRPVLVVK
jgi:nucleotide-binding universal stress UspA family protein